MGTPLRVLNVEDNEDDARLLLRHLSGAGYDVTFERVDTSEAMRVALDERSWDIVITDYVLPNFSAPAALAMLKDRNPKMPVIVVAGAEAEEAMALETMLAGVHDYLVKTDVARLVPAIGLAAGVIAPEGRAAAHLALCREYLHLPEPNLGKAMYHAEEALTCASPESAERIQAMLFLGTCQLEMGDLDESIRVLEQCEAEIHALAGVEPALAGEVQEQLGVSLAFTGQTKEAAGALRRAEENFRAAGLGTKAADCLVYLAELGPAAEAAGEAPVAAGMQPPPGSLRLEQGKYLLSVGNVAEAVKETIEALHEAGDNSELCHHCYMLLNRCALVQGHTKDALHFAVSALIMAVDACQDQLSREAVNAFMTAYQSEGEGREVLVHQMVIEYRKYGLDLYRHLPVLP